MNITLTRDVFGATWTLSTLYVDGLHFAYAVEDQDRGLVSSMSLEEIRRLKVKTKTCIPYGSYKVYERWSEKHGCYLLGVTGVPGFQNIEFHPGNSEKDTDGCILPVMERDTLHGTGARSRVAAKWLYYHVKAHLDAGGDCILDVVKST